jgi:hypothetical protein
MDERTDDLLARLAAMIMFGLWAAVAWRLFG